MQGEDPGVQEDDVFFGFLPNEVAEHVLQWLRPADLGTARLVCRRWAGLIASIPAWTDAQALAKLRCMRLPSRELQQPKSGSTPTTCRIAMAGPGGVGRSSCIVRYVTGQFPLEYEPVVCDDYEVEATVDEVPVKLEINVSAGQDEYLSLVAHILNTREACLVMYSVTDRRSFERMGEYLRLIHQGNEAAAKPIIVLANKLDALSCQERQVTPAEGMALADKWARYSWGLEDRSTSFNFKHNFFECSAKGDYFIEYTSRASGRPFTAADTLVAAGLEPEEVMDAPDGARWKMTRGLGGVVAELVRQADMWRQAVQDGALVHASGLQTDTPAKADNARNKKCLVC